MEKFASYEKEYLESVTIIKHTIRIILNSTKKSLMESLKFVPDNASVTMIVDDIELGGYGEIVFEEEYKSKSSKSSKR